MEPCSTINHQFTGISAKQLPEENSFAPSIRLRLLGPSSVFQTIQFTATPREICYYLRMEGHLAVVVMGCSGSPTNEPTKVVHNVYPNPGLHLNTTTEDHTVHPNQGVGIDLGRNGLTAHHNADLPKWLEGKCVLQKCCDLYNCLPPGLRRPLENDDEPNFDLFKSDLDKWLTTIPDQPTATRRFRPAQTNSILDQIDYIAK